VDIWKWSSSRDERLCMCENIISRDDRVCMCDTWIHL
jgi:hypothetical protein